MTTVPARTSRPHPLRTLAWAGVVALLVIGPAFGFARLTVLRPIPHHLAVVPQVDVAGASPPAGLVARLRSLPASPSYPPVVITYHDISEQGTDYSLTPRAFAEQMRLLHDSGWHSLTADEFDGWLRGKPLPAHSVLITFDDGARGVWRYADPVLRRYDLHGIAFIITGFVGTHQPYYMTWQELDRLRASGRWDLEAHTYLGHVQVPSDANGTLQPFLATRMWLPAQHRRETLAEFTARVRGDLTHCIRDLVAHGAPSPLLFAYPFSARGVDVVGTQLHQVVRSLFDASFLDSSAGAPTRLSELLSREFRRVDVLRQVDLDQFVQSIEDSLQRPVRPLGAGSWRQAQWVSTTGDSVHLPAAGPVPLSEALTGNQYAEMHLDPSHTSFWNDYRATVSLAGLRGEVGASVHALLYSPDQVQVVVTSSRYSIYQGSSQATRLVGEGDLPVSGPDHQVEVTVRTGSVRVVVDGYLLTTLVTNTASRGGVTVGGDPEHDAQAPALDSVSVTPLVGS